MTKALKMMGLLLVAGLIAGNSFGLVLSDLGSNITISDESPDVSAWGSDPHGPGDEDNEVDYWATQGQEWDLEGFFFDAATMTLTGVGGFDFENGYGGMLAGDVFIDITGDAQIPADIPSTTSNFGYDYVLDFGWNDGTDALTYDIIAIADGVVLESATRVGSNPYRYDSDGGQFVDTGIVLTADVSYFTGLGDDLDGNGTVDVYGDVYGGPGTHNAFQIDMSWLGDQGFTVHQTMECGNDGHNGHVPDGGVTLALLGMALVGLGAIARKK